MGFSKEQILTSLVRFSLRSRNSKRNRLYLFFFHKVVHNQSFSMTRDTLRKRKASPPRAAEEKAPRKKSKKTKEHPRVLSDDATLDTHGLMKIRLDLQGSKHLNMILSVLVFLCDWWIPFVYENLKEKMSESPVSAKSTSSIEEVRELYGFTDSSGKDEEENINKTLEQVGKRLGEYRSKEGKKKYSEKEMSAFSKAFEGNTVAQFHCYKTWTKTGFGLTTKITGTMLHFMLFEKVMEIFRNSHSKFVSKLVPSGLPHAIIKLPSHDGALKAHVDFRGRSFAYLKNALYECDSMNAWIEMYGCQTLLHVYCGTGSTLGLENLTIEVFRLMMTMLNPEKPFPALENFMTSKKWNQDVDGPNFFSFWDKRLLAAVNKALTRFFNKSSALPKETTLSSEERKWCEDLPILVSKPLRILKASPLPIFLARMSPDSTQPHLVMWPAGFPHGANVEDTRIRYTMTVPVDFPQNINMQKVNRVTNRSRALYRPEHQKIEDHTIADAGGLTHKHPELVFDFFKRFESFRSLYPATESDMEKCISDLFEN